MRRCACTSRHAHATRSSTTCSAGVARVHELLLVRPRVVPAFRPRGRSALPAAADGAVHAGRPREGGACALSAHAPFDASVLRRGGPHRGPLRPATPLFGLAPGNPDAPFPAHARDFPAPHNEFPP